ncbi:MAG TPA: hypothetical protein VGF13_12365 [Verrucomicrobiae bacterium]|jgi:hypothetical protein
MKMVGANEQSIIFQLSNRERDALIKILQAYPVLPAAHQPVSRELKDSHLTDYQRLLDEALAEQRNANKRHLEEWLAPPERFHKTKSGCRFTLERADSEWLLQVLNDIRVGHWLRLGSPDASVMKPENLDLKTIPIWLAMEMSGYFQMSILEALGS